MLVDVIQYGAVYLLGVISPLLLEGIKVFYTKHLQKGFCYEVTHDLRGESLYYGKDHIVKIMVENKGSKPLGVSIGRTKGYSYSGGGAGLDCDAFIWSWGEHVAGLDGRTEGSYKRILPGEIYEGSVVVSRGFYTVDHIVPVYIADSDGSPKERYEIDFREDMGNDFPDINHVEARVKDKLVTKSEFLQHMDKFPKEQEKSYYKEWIEQLDKLS